MTERKIASIINTVICKFVIIVALKKPSELLDTKESSGSFLDSTVQKYIEQPQLNSFSEVFDSFKNNLSNIEVLSGKVEEIQAEVKSLLKQEDLERAMVSQLLVLEQSIRDVQDKVKGINESNLESIRDDITNLSSTVNDFIEVEVPKYQKISVESEFRIGKNFSQLESNVNKSLDVVNESLDVINEFVENKYQELAESLEGINEQSLSGIVEDFKNLENIINEFKTNDIPKYKDFIASSEKRSETLVNEKLEQFDSKVQGSIDSIDAKVVSEVSELNDKFLELKEDIPSYKKFIVETEIKNDKNLKEFREKLDNTTSSILEKVSLIDRDHTDLVDIVTGKVSEVNDLVSAVNFSEEKFKKSIEKKVSDLEIEVIRNESHLKIQNKNLERVQEDIKLSLTGLNDLVEECDKYDYDLGKKIKYIEELFSKFDEKELLTEGLFNNPSETNSDPLTPTDQEFVTLDQLQNHYRVFINRIQQQLSTLGGGGETRLKYLDDVVGVATNASAYDGKFLAYDDAIKKFEFKNIPEPSVTLAEENITYVAKDGDDSNDGTIGRPKLTIKNAVESIVATGKTDQVVRVAPGTYIEDNPIILPDELTVIGHSLRENTVIPLNDNKDLFYVGNGNYIAEMSFRGSLPGKAIVAFDPEKPRYIVQSPYIQNCTNFIPDSIGLRIDGDATIGPLKSMVLDSYTQYNQGGIGCSITNQGYAQLVSLFTICDEIAVFCGSGGACDLTNSNSSFGDFGIVADGVSGKLFSGIVTTAASELSDSFELLLEGPELSVSNALYDKATGLTTITTSSNHNLNVGAAVTISDLKFTCDSFTDIEEYTVSNAVYDEQSGILTVTTASNHNFNVGISVTFSNLVFSCDSGSGVSTAFFPPALGDNNGDPNHVFDVLTIPSSDSFSVNVGPSTISHTYDQGGVVAISTIANFPNGNQGYVFNVQKINSSTEFETYVGVSTFIHTYDSGGNVKLNLVRPYDGTLLFFNELYETVDSVTITDGGSGYTESPIITISEPSEPWGIRARAIANVSNGSITSIDMISNGRGYTSDATVTIADNSSGINTAIGVAVMQPEYYAVVSSTEISGGITTVTVNENVPFSVGVGTTANFFKQSRILASGHSFEFVGAGNDISRATPFSGGFPPIPENETVSKNGGLVIFTSTNQSGNFKIGDGVTINQSTSSITGQAYEKSLVSTMTPYILSLGGL